MEMREMIMLPNNKIATIATESHPAGWRDVLCENKQVFISFPPSIFDIDMFADLTETKVYNFLYNHQFSINDHYHLISLQLN